MFADSPVGVQMKGTQLLAAVDIWERQTADREIISIGAAALWELSSAAVMLLRERGQGLLGETFHSKIRQEIVALYSSH